MALLLILRYLLFLCDVFVMSNSAKTAPNEKEIWKGWKVRTLKIYNLHQVDKDS